MQADHLRQAPCGAPQSNGTTCMETKSLSIVHEFNKIYEDQISRIDRMAGDNIELKYPVYCDWVSKLIEQNTDLVELVEELEREACLRLNMLEMKSKEDFTKMKNLKTDQNNVLEVLKRAREHRRWDADGLQFHYVTHEDLFGRSDIPPYMVHDIRGEHVTTVEVDLRSSPRGNADTTQKEQELIHLKEQLQRLQQEIQLKEQRIKDLEAAKAENDAAIAIDTSKLEARYQAENADFLTIMNELKETINERDRQLQSLTEDNRMLTITLNSMQKDLNDKEMECISLKKTSIDTRALVMEVAEKHDSIVKYRNEINAMEEQLKRKDVHIHFKDEIIRDLRRECRKSNRPSMRPTGMVETGNTSCNETEVGNASNCESSALHQNVARRSSIALSKYAHESAREDASIQLLHKELQDLYDQIAQRDENIAQQYTAINELRLKLDSRDIDSVMLQNFLAALERVYEAKLKQRNQSSTTSIAANEFTSGVFSDAISNVQTKIAISSAALSERQPNDELTVNRAMLSVLRDMGDKLTTLKVENLEFRQMIDQLNNTVRELQNGEGIHFTRLSKRNSGNDYRENESKIEEDAQLYRSMLAKVLVNIATDFARILGKHLSAESLSAVESGDAGPLVTLMKQLRQEICTKDSLLKDKEETMRELLAKVKQLEHELHDSQKRYTVVAKERDLNIVTMQDLGHTVSSHLDTISQLNASKTQLENDLRDVRQLIVSQDHSDKSTQERCRKLENECKHQLTTISNLRAALEDSSKRSSSGTVGVTAAASTVGTAPLAASTVSSGATVSASTPPATSISSNTHSTSMWGWWRTVHDV